MELYWGTGFQIYATPVGPEEVCVALISSDPHFRMDDALARMPEIATRLRDAETVASERGAVSASRWLRSVCRGNLALVGDASGSVDAITGEGLCLSFRQAAALADALAAGDLEAYQAVHRRMARRPALMAELMLAFDRSPSLRHRALRAMSGDPDIFARMLAMHVGALAPRDFAIGGVTLGWRMLTA
jgi:flavin-dependent dehydrogenase